MNTRSMKSLMERKNGGGEVDRRKYGENGGEKSRSDVILTKESKRIHSHTCTRKCIHCLS